MVLLCLSTSLFLGIIVGQIFGYDAKQVIIQYFFPINGDGLSGGIIPMDETIDGLKPNGIFKRDE
jgi:Na+/citrate or Na+/malate symporter